MLYTCSQNNHKANFDCVLYKNQKKGSDIKKQLTKILTNS